MRAQEGQEISGIGDYWVVASLYCFFSISGIAHWVKVMSLVMGDAYEVEGRV